MFKPALVEREIEETIRAEAKKVGADIQSLTVEHHPHEGLRAVVETDQVGALRQALDRYAFKSEVSAAHD